MGYGASELGILASKLRDLSPGCALLELGAQEINGELQIDSIVSIARAAHRDNEKAAQAAAARYDPSRRFPISALFEGSPYRYRCIDLMPGPMTLVADLNTFSVPPNDRGSFDLITNFGTSEHVADQINTFRVVHDFARPGALFLHYVPFAGYFNHGLYNYHPLFFVFLAAANDYEIETLGLSAPHLPFTIPQHVGLMPCSEWAYRPIDSGILVAHLRKRTARSFELFTDYDQSVMKRMHLPEPWATMLRDRYDLRIREAL